MSYPTIARGQPIPYGYGGLDSLPVRLALDAKHAAENETDAFLREREEAEASLQRRFLLLCSLGDGKAPVPFLKGDLLAADIVWEAIGYDRDLQREAMGLILTLARGDCTAAKELLKRAAPEWAEQNIGSELP